MAGARQPVAGFSLSLDGTAIGGTVQDITGKVRPRLKSLTLTSKRGDEADQLDLVLDDSDGKMAIPRKGAKIMLSLGWERGAGVPLGLVDMGSFAVDETEWGDLPYAVTIRARALDMRDAMRVRRERSWCGKTLGDIAREVAGANRLEPRIAGELAAIEIPVLAQHHTSDMALLRRLGRVHDAVATVKNGKLILAPIGKGASVGGKPLAPVLITPDMGSGARLSFTDRGEDAGVEARWHDQDVGEKKTVKAGGGKGTPKRLRRTYHSEDSARRAAEAENKRTKRSGAEFAFNLAYGRADLIPETPVRLQGFKAEADAVAWILVEATHSLDGSGGFKTAFKLEQRS